MTFFAYRKEMRVSLITGYSKMVTTIQMRKDLKTYWLLKFLDDIAQKQP